MDLLRRYPLISALGILAALLLAVLALEVASGSSLRERLSSRSKPPAAKVSTRLLPQVAAVNPDQEYAETGTRPLFTPTRRPAPPQAQVAATTMPKGQYVLTGVTIVGPTKIALLREKSSGRVVRVEEGKDVNGITVAQIDPEQVKLTQGGDSEVVQMLVTKGGAAAHPAPASAPTAAAGPFAPVATAQPAPPPGPNPTGRPMPPPAVPGQPAQPPVNPNTLFGPRPGGLTPVPDPTTATPPTSQAAPLTPEQLLARRRARRNQQSQ